MNAHNDKRNTGIRKPNKKGIEHSVIVIIDFFLLRIIFLNGLFEPEFS